MFQAFITTHRGTGRPNRPAVREGESMEQADPMAAWNGCAWVGAFQTREEAQTAVNAAWDEWTTTDSDGWCQWAD